MGFEEASGHAEEVRMARNWDQALAESQKETEVVNSVAFKELNTTTNHKSLEVDPSPLQTFCPEPSPHWHHDHNLWEGPVQLCLPSDPQKLWGHK